MGPCSDGSGSKIFDPGWVSFLWLGSGWVSHLWFGLEFGKFPLKCQIFQFFSLWVKKNLFGRVKKYPGQRQVSLLFAAGQKCARVGLGQGPSLV